MAQVSSLLPLLWSSPRASDPLGGVEVLPCPMPAIGPLCGASLVMPSAKALWAPAPHLEPPWDVQQGETGPDEQGAPLLPALGWRVLLPLPGMGWLVDKLARGGGSPPPS